ncbi:MAG: flagellar biosynthesis anti-sigma factor FlgM [Legionella sp.]|nr:flagellar biosynthesis anti-sigma factor FlgM [Legionella sp.]
MPDLVKDKPMLHHFVELASAKIKGVETIADNSLVNKMTTKQLDQLLAQSRDMPEFNEARIMYFKAKIQLGDYEINNTIIAKKLLNLDTASIITN